MGLVGAPVLVQLADFHRGIDTQSSVAPAGAACGVAVEAGAAGPTWFQLMAQPPDAGLRADPVVPYCYSQRRSASHTD